MLNKLKIAKKVSSIKNIKNFVLKKINFSQNKNVKHKINILGDKIINKNLYEIKKFN